MRPTDVDSTTACEGVASVVATPSSDAPAASSQRGGRDAHHGWRGAALLSLWRDAFGAGGGECRRTAGGRVGGAKWRGGLWRRRGARTTGAAMRCSSQRRRRAADASRDTCPTSAPTPPTRDLTSAVHPLAARRPVDGGSRPSRPTYAARPDAYYWWTFGQCTYWAQQRRREDHRLVELTTGIPRPPFDG